MRKAMLWQIAGIVCCVIGCAYPLFFIFGAFCVGKAMWSAATKIDKHLEK